MSMATATAASVPVRPYAVDLSKGQVDSTVSSQWFSRPVDERYEDLDTLYRAKKDAWDRTWESRIDSRSISFDAPYPQSLEDKKKLTVGVNVRQPGADISRTAEVAPTHWAFNQLCQLAKAPPGYLRELPSQMVAEQLRYRMRFARDVEELKLYGSPDMLFAATGPTYGRIPDHEVVRAVQTIAGNGLGKDARYHWKTPGKLDWSNGTYDPEDMGSKEDRTFYGSDRDLFIFLADDRRPIVVGKTRDGRDDLMFRGFYVQNSEVGSRTLKVHSFYLRGVCMNRNLWGCEGFEEVAIRHTAKAPERWLEEVVPALESYAKASDRRLIDAVNKAKAAKLAKDEDEELAFLRARDFSKGTAKKIMVRHEAEEGAPMRTAWDFCQGITAYARDLPNTDARLGLELVAGKILERVA